MNKKLNEDRHWLKIFLNLIYYTGIVLIICFSIAYFAFQDLISIKPSFVMLIASVAAYSCGLAIINELIKINDTLIIKTPFIMENVKSMKKIATYLFIISGYVFVKDWIRLKAHFIVYTFDNNGLNTDTNCLIFVMLGVLVLILGRIFRTAIEIKSENDLTI